MSAPQPPTPPLDERKFAEDVAAKKRELDLKEREIVAREREVLTKEIELQRSRLWNPTVIGLFAAALGLIGSVVVAQVNNNNTQNLERYRSQSNLVLEAIKTGNSDAACRNLLFFVKLRLLDDPNKAILGQCDSVPKGAPSLPAAATDVFDGMFKVEGRVLDKADHTPIEGVELTLEVPVYFVNRPELRITTSDSQGRFRFKINAFVATAKLTAAKNGYNPSEESVTIEVGNLLFSSRP